MTDQHFYDLVAAELERGHLDRGAWTKAFADAEGDQVRTRAMNIRARVGQLQQEPLQESLAAARREQAQRQIEKRIAIIEGLPLMLFVFALILIAGLAIWFLWLKG